MLRFVALLTVLLVLYTVPGWAQRTVPVQPRIQETPLPPPVTLPAPPTPPADVPNRPLTAQEAAQIALHHQPNVTAAIAGVAASQGITEQARSGERPNISLNGAYNNEAIAAEGGLSPSGAGSSSTGFLAAANVRQLIYDFNHTRDTVQQAIAQELATRANLTRVQLDTIFQVKQAFYAYVQAEHLIGVSEANVRNLQSHLALAQARLNAGVGLPVDVVRAQTAVSDAILTLNLAQNAASVAQVNLALIMGIDPRTPILVAETNEPAPPADDPNRLITVALQRRPDVIEAAENLRAAQYGISVAKTTNSPALVGVAGYTTRGIAFPPFNSALGFGVSVQWDPFDGGFTQGRVEQAKGNQQIAAAQLTAVQSGVVSDVAQAYLNLKTAEQRQVTARDEVANAEEALRLAQGRYQSGIGVFLDVLDAQIALVTAQTNLVNAQSAINQARAALSHSIAAS